jgi:hypothetical protein
MSQPDRQADEGTVELLAAVGVTATDEGKARARARIADAEARWTDEKWAELREQLGLPTRTA